MGERTGKDRQNAMKDITILMKSPSTHQRSHGAALAKGIRKIGLSFAIQADKYGAPKTKNVACWGWRIGKRMMDAGYNVLVMERGYIGDRFKYTSLGWNGLNGHAFFPSYEDDGGKRFADHGGVIKPWKTGGDYVLILGQVPGDMSLQGRDMLPYYMEAAAKIKKIHGIPVYFRPHPEAIRKGFKQEVPGAMLSTGTLDEALSGAVFTVCFNSNSSVDSVLAGIPCVVGDKGTMAWDMCGHEIGEIVRGEREKWAHQLAFTQWTLGEIESGLPLKKLFKV
jgi:hypothetical protein